MKTFDILDILSPRPKLYVNSNKRYITLIGIFISSLLFISYVTLILYFFIDFCFSSSITVGFTTEEVSSDFSFNLKQNEEHYHSA